MKVQWTEETHGRVSTALTEVVRTWQLVTLDSIGTISRRPDGEITLETIDGEEHLLAISRRRGKAIWV